MPETIIIPKGTKLKIDGNRYQTVEETVTDGVTLSPIEPSGGNHWLALYCPDEDCRKVQADAKRQAGKLRGRSAPYIVVRVNRSVDDAAVWAEFPDASARPMCGLCGHRMVFVPADEPEESND